MDKYFVRQFIVVFSILLDALCDGISMCFPGVINSSILSPNTTDLKATLSEASWIAAAPGLGCFVGIIISSSLVQTIGRKATHAVTASFDLISWSILPFANSINTVFGARLIRGFGEGLYVKDIIISEYSDPKRRGYFLTMTKLCIGIGSLICHTMAFWYTWRQISFIPIVSLFTSIALTFFWKESPAYCALRGRFTECQRNHIWLHGNSKEKQNEVEHLMAAQYCQQELSKNKKKKRMKSVLEALLKRDFLKALLITMLSMMILDFSGKYYYLAYIKQIYLMIFEDQSLASYCSVFSDLLTVVGLILSCFIIRYFKRRTLMFGFGAFTVVLMLSISIADFLKSMYSLGLQQKWIIPCLLLLLNFIVSMGVASVNFTLSVEMFSLEHRGLGCCLAGFIIMFFYIISMKFTPMILDVLGLSGTYGVFSIGIIICLVILYFIVPETKNRTMQEIDDEMNNVERSVIELRPMLLKNMNVLES